MDISPKKYVKLIAPEASAETRAAALLVAGELGLREAEVMAAVASCLNDPIPEVRLNAMRAAGQLKMDSLLVELLDRIPQGGPDASMAAEAVAGMGPKGVKALQELMHKVVPGVRKYIAAALTASGAEAAAVAVLLDRDPQVAASAAAAIIAKLPTLAGAKKTELVAELARIARDKKKPLPASSEVALVRVMIAANNPLAAEALWDRVLLPHTSEVRAACLQAVGGWTTNPNKEQLKKLFQCASEPDFRVVAPALAILNKLPLTEKLVPDWVQLLRASDMAARRLAMEKIGDRDTPDIAEAMLAQLQHTDRAVRDSAAERLIKLKAGRKVLLASLLAAQGHDETWQLARVVMPFSAELDTVAVSQLRDQACMLLEKHDHRTDPFLYVLREHDAAGLQSHLTERAIGFRKKKKHDIALSYLKIVARDPAIGFDVRLEMAINGLKVSAKDVAPPSREGDPCLRSFETLFHQDSERLTQELSQMKFLDDDDLFYVGFHFYEQIGRSRQFGIDLLKLVVKRSPKSEAGKSAKNKLKSVGV